MGNSNIWDVKKAEKVCCFDIDGVLNSYPDCWMDYVCQKTGVCHTDLNSLKKSLSYEQYRTLKKEYRLSGIKEKLTPTSDASYVTQRLKKLGWTIIIVTARPAQEHPCLSEQTRRWLDNCNIAYSHIEFGQKNKRGKILEDFPNIKFAVEDNSYLANTMASWGYKVFLMHNKYNRGLKLEKKVQRIYKLKDILKSIT